MDELDDAITNFTNTMLESAKEVTLETNIIQNREILYPEEVLEMVKKRKAERRLW
jgi:hypothetical protein